jgi:hypothetical protein
MSKPAHLFVLLVALICLPLLVRAQDDLSTPDGLMKSFYACLDVKKGKHIDSTRFMNLFWGGAQLDGIVPSRKDTTKLVNFSITPQEYLHQMKGFTATHYFKEWETGRQTLSFGHMMCIYSGYELVDITPKGDTINLRGVNVFNIFYDQTRWWITYCTYEEENGAITVPENLKTPAKKPD